MARKPYPSDVTDEEWSFVAPYLTLMREDAPQRGQPDDRPHLKFTTPSKGTCGP
jgi:hypothetical protein